MADVSERKLSEESLRLMRERLALALQAGQMGVFDFDIVNDVLWWAPQTYDVFGVSPETFTPTRESVIDLVHPDDRKGFIQGRLQALARREPFVQEYRCLRSDGRIAWISHRGQAEYDAGGRPVRSFGVALDITERKLAEQALQEADRSKDSFIATLAHELRNPLAPIRNAVQRAAPDAATTIRSCARCRDDDGPAGDADGAPARRPARRLRLITAASSSCAAAAGAAGGRSSSGRERAGR